MIKSMRFFSFIIILVGLCSMKELPGTDVALRAAAFYPTSSLFRKIYGDLLPSFQMEVNTPFGDRLDIWTNFEWVSQRGDSDGFNKPTSMHLATLGIGIKYLYPIREWYSAYLGLGPCIAEIALHNQTSCERTKVSRTAFGVIVKSGLLFQLNSNYFADFFLDYVYLASPFKTRADLGGVKLGAGLGVKF